MNIKLIDHAHRDVIDDVVEVLRIVIERGHWWQDHHAHARQLQHVFQMNFTERRLAYDEHQFTPLFQHYVSRPMNQVVAETVCDSCERAHAAWRDHHAERHERTARDCGALIADAVAVRGQICYVFNRILSFVRERARGPLANDEMSLDARAVQHLQQAHAEDRSSRAGYTDNQP